MINHGRSLLLNLDGAGYSGTLGDEYVPAEYVAPKLPTYLEKLRIYLFGTSPDRAFLNYRTQQLLSLLHATPLVEFLTDLDPRITYDMDNLGMFSDSNYELKDTASIFFGNKLGAPDVTGQSFHRWRIAGIGDERVRVTRQAPVQGVETYDYTVMAGLSDSLPLLGSAANFRFRTTGTCDPILVGSALPYLTSLTPEQLDLLTSDELHVLALNFPPGAICADYYVEGYARPERDLGTITTSLRESGVPYTINLFGLGTPVAATEPFKTFRNLWNNHPELAYQLGGLLLAIIYRTEEQRLSNG